MSCKKTGDLEGPPYGVQRTCFLHYITRRYEPRWLYIRELKQPRRRRQQKADKFAYLTMKNRIFARFARAFFSF